jgi:hypothetical protein
VSSSHLLLSQGIDDCVSSFLGPVVPVVTRRHPSSPVVTRRYPALVGIAIGLGVSWALEGVVVRTMFGWQSSGPLAMALVGGALLIVAVIAAAGPARSVLRIDPTISLRAE